jgi:predicted MFS family arabinose efflux permease
MSFLSDRSKVLAAGVFNLILSMGVARFAYTPLLPQMQEQAGLGVADAGWLASINYIGYLSGALIASLVGSPELRDRLYRGGMVVAVLTTAMMGVTTDPVLWAVSRYFAGLSTAAGTLLGTGLILNWLIVHDHRGELGIPFSGVGLGIAGTAAAVVLMNHLALDWRSQWYAFTAVGCLLLVPALLWMPAPERRAVTRSGQSMQDAPPAPAFLRLLMAAYFCAGVGYVVSGTFIVAIVDRVPGMAGHGTLVFLFVGLGSVPASVLTDLIARRLGDLNALILVAALQIAGILLPVLGGGLLAALLGAALFGATVMGLVGLVLTMAGRYYPTNPARMMGKMSLAYGVALVIAPAVTGWLATRLGSYRDGLYLAAVVMAIGTVLLVLLRIADAREPVADGRTR